MGPGWGRRAEESVLRCETPVGFQASITEADMDIWKAEDDVMATVKQLVANHHPHLAPILDQIAVLFREKASTSGEVVLVGKTKKAPAILKTLGEREYIFIIELAKDEWDNLDDKEKVALLDHHLCACQAKEDSQTGDLSYFVASPDVSFFEAEVKRHGFWRIKGSPADEGLLEEMFGEARKAAADADDEEV